MYYKPDCETFAKIVAMAIEKKEAGVYGAEQFCTILELQLDNQGIYDFEGEEVVRYNGIYSPDYENFSKAVLQIIDNLNLENKKKLEKKEICENAYSSIKELMIEYHIPYDNNISNTPKTR